MRRFLMRTVTAAVLIVAGMQIAHAAPITGNINLVGDFQPVDGGVATQDLSAADGIDFLAAGGGTGTFQTLSANGDLSTYANLSGGTIKDFTFSPFVPVLTFYAIGTGGNTLSFDLTTINIDTQNTNFLNLSGSGILYATGFDPTLGTFFFSGQSSNGTSPTAKFSWSAGSAALPVPEPGSLALIGLGLLATSLLRRRSSNT